MRRAAVPVAVGSVLGAWAGALALRDPHVEGSWGFCPFRALTGLPCPLCGGLRAVWDLEHGRVVGALGSNALVVVALPVVAVWLGLWAARSWRGSAAREVPLPGRRTTVVLLVGVAAFGALRWLPALAWFAP